jgi:hypothetical protein
MRRAKSAGKGDGEGKQQTYHVCVSEGKENGKETCRRYLAGKSGPTMVQIKAKGKLLSRTPPVSRQPYEYLSSNRKVRFLVPRRQSNFVPMAGFETCGEYVVFDRWPDHLGFAS